MFVKLYYKTILKTIEKTDLSPFEPKLVSELKRKTTYFTNILDKVILTLKNDAGMVKSLVNTYIMKESVI